MSGGRAHFRPPHACMYIVVHILYKYNEIEPAHAQSHSRINKVHVNYMVVCLRAVHVNEHNDIYYIYNIFVCARTRPLFVHLPSSLLASARVRPNIRLDAPPGIHLWSARAEVVAANFLNSQPPKKNSMFS